MRDCGTRKEQYCLKYKSWHNTIANATGPVAGKSVKCSYCASTFMCNSCQNSGDLCLKFSLFRMSNHTNVKHAFQTEFYSSVVCKGGHWGSGQGSAVWQGLGSSVCRAAINNRWHQYTGQQRPCWPRGEVLKVKTKSSYWWHKTWRKVESFSWKDSMLHSMSSIDWIKPVIIICWKNFNITEVQKLTLVIESIRSIC